MNTITSLPGAAGERGSVCSSYVLITPARNEEFAIEATVQSVIKQSLKPKLWIIVSDGSTDRTDTIVQQYAAQFPYIQLVRSDNRQGRNFASKVSAFNKGYAALRDESYEFIGNLDADVIVDSGYFANLLDRFATIPGLGLAGGMIHEFIGERAVSQNLSLNSVAGAVQLFRRKCFEDIGGYVPLTSGGVDTVAEILARMRGWEVRTFPELPVYSRRAKIGSGNIYAARFRHGVNSYRFGYHPLFLTLSSIYRISHRPVLLGGLSSFAGYLWAFLRREKVVLPREVVRFLQTEQLARIRTTLLNRARLSVPAH